MAFILANSCEGTPAAAVTTANSAGPSQFTSVNVSGTGSSLVYSNAQVYSGSTSLLATIGSVAGAAYPAWGLPYSAGTVYNRQYLYLPAAVPAAGFRVYALYDSTGVNHRASVFITTNRMVQTVNAAYAQVSLGTHAIPIGQWVRLEFDVTGSAAAGVVTSRLYLTPENAGTPDETLTATAQATGGQIGQTLFGAYDTEVTWSWYSDGLVSTDIGAVGPQGTVSAGGNATTATDLGGGSGSWTSPANAQGAPDSVYATWTAP